MSPKNAKDPKDVKIKGVFIKSLINTVERERGGAGMERLKEIYGDFSEISSFKSYPIELENKMVHG